MKALRLLLVPFALLVVAAMRLGLPIRFGAIMSTRIGHMAGNMECYLCEREAGLSKGLDFFYHVGEPADMQLAKMLARVVRIDPTPFARICDLLNRAFVGWQKNAIDTAQVDRDILNLFEKQGPHLSFTSEEHVRGFNGLRAMGIPSDVFKHLSPKWVCLMARDAGYLPHLAYHSYRDSDIDTYEQAAIALAERGYYVVRMGAKVVKPFKVNHPRVIDYATKHKSDFMDIYLGAHCAFALSNGCGIDAVPVIFRRPVCYVNYVPVEYLQTYNAGSLAIWKHHEKDGKRMTFAEIIESGAGQFMRADEFEEAGIKLVDNTPEEIAAVALEMADYISMPRPFKWQQQEEFWRTFPRSVSQYNQKPLHGEIRMRIGAEFLRQYQERLPELYQASPDDFVHEEQWARAFHGD